MKKTYLKPNTDVIAVKTQQMIANSIASVSGIDGLSVGGEFEGTTVDSRLLDDVADDYDWDY